MSKYIMQNLLGSELSIEKLHHFGGEKKNKNGKESK